MTKDDMHIGKVAELREKRLRGIESLCAGRTPEQIAEAFRLLDNREKVVEKIENIQYHNDYRNSEGSVSRTAIDERAAECLALLAEKKGKP